VNNTGNIYFDANAAPLPYFANEDFGKPTPLSIKFMWLNHHYRQVRWAAVEKVYAQLVPPADPSDPSNVAASQEAYTTFRGIWRDFNRAVSGAYESLRQELKNEKAPNDERFHDQLDAFEIQYFGQIRTTSDGSAVGYIERRQFWQNLGLKISGGFQTEVTPSDLIEPLDVELGFRKAVAIMAATFSKEPPDDVTIRYRVRLTLADKALAELGRPDPEPFNVWIPSGVSAMYVVHRPFDYAMFRREVGIYLSRGVPEETLAAPFTNQEDVGARSLLLASMVTPELAANVRRGWKPLSYWRDAGMEGWADKLTLTSLPTVKLSAPYDFTAQEEESRRAVAARRSAQREELYAALPLQQRVLIPLVVEQLVLEGPIGLTDDISVVTNFNPEGGGERFDQVETQYFGCPLTSGDLYQRHQTWSVLGAKYAEWLHKLTVELHKVKDRKKVAENLYAGQISASVEGWLLSGADSRHVCKLVGAGRGGLTQPVPSSEVEGQNAYKSLSYWANVSGWSLPILNRYFAVKK